MQILLFLFLSIITLTAETLTFGVFTYRTPEKIIKEYQPIADYLSKELNATIIVKPLDQEELEEQVLAGKIDIIATNPTHYLSLQKQGKTTGAIATLIKRYDNTITQYLGGAIITRADRSDIHLISNLKGKTIAIPGQKFLGGYQTQAYELFLNGVDIENDTKTFIVKNHEAVINTVLSGSADAGFVRSGIIEEMVRNNQLNLKEIFVIHEQKFSYFPMKTSTRLYPEWAIVTAKTLPADTVSKIAVALYGYQNTTKGNDIIAGFTISGDYAEIDTLARSLRIPPYDVLPTFTLQDIWTKHGIFIIVLASITTLFFIILGLLYKRATVEKKYAQSILNATPNPTVITDGEFLIRANNSFLNFVGFSTLEAFQLKHNCICDFFQEGDTDEYLLPTMEDKTWIEYILANPMREHKAKITINNKTTIFKIDASLVEDNNLFRVIAVFNDISAIIGKSTTDTLTRIANRMHFNLLYEHALHVGVRENTPLSLIFFDIDHFKRVNDTHGHLVGDSVLRFIANIVKKSLRKSDLIARWGGEEFIILLPNTSADFASEVAENLRRMIQNEVFDVVGQVTCSFGVTQLVGNEGGDKLLQRIDELLYDAKANGRNRVVVG
ncbi:MAG: PhnD/SsuA/transferrin family substrate-binding protein [Sulfurimonas sp.]|jgi:diguanylate cyclase (GGDEF)-like protein